MEYWLIANNYKTRRALNGHVSLSHRGSPPTLSLTRGGGTHKNIRRSGTIWFRSNSAFQLNTAITIIARLGIANQIISFSDSLYGEIQCCYGWKWKIYESCNLHCCCSFFQPCSIKYSYLSKTEKKWKTRQELQNKQTV